MREKPVTRFHSAPAPFPGVADERDEGGIPESLRVLLVDDNPDDRDLVARALRKHAPEIDVIHAVDMDAFTAAVLEGAFDVVVTDYAIRWTDGITVLKAVKGAWPECPVVMFTGTGSEEVAVAAMKEGLDDYVVKSPSHFARLPLAVARALAHCRGKREAAEAQWRYRDLFDGVPVGLFRLSGDGTVTHANRALLDCLGYAEPDEFFQEALLGMSSNAPAGSGWLDAVRKHGVVTDFGFPTRRSNGFPVWLRLGARTVAGPPGGTVALEGSVQDITQARRAEEELRESEDRYRSLFENNHAVMLVIDPATGRIEDVNAAACAYYGYSRRSFLALRLPDLNTRSAEETAADVEKTRKTGNRRFFMRHRLAGGEVRDVEIFTGPIQVSGRTLLYSIVHDVTARRDAERRAKDHTAFLQTVLETIPSPVFVKDLEGRYIYCNTAFASENNRERDAILGLKVEDIRPPEHVKAFDELNVEAMRTGSVLGRELVLEGPDARFTVFLVSRKVLKDTRGRIVGLVGISVDITSQKETERQLGCLTREHELILSAAADGIVQLDSGGIVTFANPAACRMLGWVQGIPAGMDHKGMCKECVTPLSAGSAGSGCAIAQAYASRSPAATEESFLCRADGGCFPAEITATPMLEGDRLLGVVLTFRDITERKASERRLRSALAKVERALAGIVHTVSAIVEMRDPYTAGHERRVADLAVAIAREMGFDEDRIHGLRTAALLHDLGKIAIPTEILSKPACLSDAEFNLVKGHPRTGHDILKDIEFPWPVARMVLEHHEKIDGSGYPAGLAGEDILEESRILAVADVVEAMASHRPYRPARGLIAALGEVESRKGILYDLRAADACLRLFREKGYMIGP